MLGLCFRSHRASPGGGTLTRSSSRVKSSIPLEIARLDRKESITWVPSSSPESNEAVVIEFTPDESGEIAFACGMNMLRGTVVINITRWVCGRSLDVAQAIGARREWRRS